MIEKGRHKRPIIPREQLVCPTCPIIVENEVQFLTLCIAYENRNELFSAIKKEVPTLFLLNYKVICTRIAISKR